MQAKTERTTPSNTRSDNAEFADMGLNPAQRVAVHPAAIGMVAAVLTLADLISTVAS